MRHNLIKIFFLFSSILTTYYSFCQTASIRGKIIDEKLNTPVEYATIALLDQTDSTLITGALADNTGTFILSDLAYGSYLLKIQFMGYKTRLYGSVYLSESQKEINLNEIFLKPSSVALEEVEIVADKPYVQYEIDKKVINVSQHINASGGTAADVLENAPSIQTDIEGNVKVRGSSNYTVLIDGKPTVLDGSDVLNQIPSGSIDKIEIITNPSAKYDPDGTSGIINIILKENSLEGFSGIINLSGGTGYQYSGDVILNYRTSKYAIFGGIEYSDFNINTTENSNRETYETDTTTFLSTVDEGNRYRGRFVIKGGFYYFLSTKNSLSLSVKSNKFSLGHDSEIKNYVRTSPIKNDYYYLNIDEFKISPDVYEFNISDEHRFSETSDHKLNTSLFFVLADVDINENLDKYLMSENWEEAIEISQLLKRHTDESRKVFHADIDYTKPVGQNGLIEAGYQLRMNHAQNDYQIEDFNIDLNQWQLDSSQTNSTNFKRNINALYATYSNKFGEWEAKAGIRAEYTYRILEQKTIGEDYIYKKPDFYPSAYITYNLQGNQKVQLSYSRRIRRPDAKLINPFTYFSDGFTAVKGNPDIKPDHTNSFELNYQKGFGASFISIETFYRQTKNKITRVQEMDENGVLVRTMKNLDNDYSLGAELMANVFIANWLELIPNITYYKYRLEGNYSATDIVKNSNNWRANLTSNLKFRTKTRIQAQCMYDGPTVTIDGEREGVFYMGLAIRQDLLNQKANITFRVMDIFDTRCMKVVSQDESFYQYSEFDAQAPRFVISFNYCFNNFQNGKQKKDDELNQYNIY